MSNNIRSEVVDDQLFVYYKEALIYKRWLKAARSMVFESVGRPTSSEDRNKIEDWEDFETIDEARNEIKRLLEENARLREENKCFEAMKEVVFNRIAGVEHVTTLLRKELEVFQEMEKKE